MPTKIIRTLLRVSSILLMLFLCSCENILYHDFRSVPEKWESGDTISFTICDPISGSHNCNAFVELRCNALYPYKKLWLRARVAGRDGVSIDTICCEIFDSLGRQRGTTAGLLYQTRHKLAPMRLLADDTVTISLTHLMNEGVVGVSDVGIRVEHCGRHLPSEN